jgi:hypothetical protein
MTTEKKTPIHKHEHPVYPWLALIIATVLILGVAGWYYITVSDGYNDDVVYSVQELSSSTASSATSVDGVDVDTEVSAVDEELNGILESDFADTQIDDTILGVQ